MNIIIGFSLLFIGSGMFISIITAKPTLKNVFLFGIGIVFIFIGGYLIGNYHS